MTHRLTRRSVVIGAGAGLLAAPYVARGQSALTRVRLTTGFALQGTHSYMLRAQKLGYARELGAPTSWCSRGFGSGRVPIDISSGTFDMAYNDMSTSLRFMAENPGADLTGDRDFAGHQSDSDHRASRQSAHQGKGPRGRHHRGARFRHRPPAVPAICARCRPRHGRRSSGCRLRSSCASRCWCRSGLTEFPARPAALRSA